MLLECVWLEPSVPAQTAGSAGAPRRLPATGTQNPQPPAVPENGMCCWGVTGRRWGSLGAQEGSSSHHKATSVLLKGVVPGGQTLLVSSVASSLENGNQKVRELPRL